MTFCIDFVHEVVQEDEHRVTPNATAIYGKSVVPSRRTKYSSPNERMRSGVPFVVSLLLRLDPSISLHYAVLARAKASRWGRFMRLAAVTISIPEYDPRRRRDV